MKKIMKCKDYIKLAVSLELKLTVINSNETKIGIVSLIDTGTNLFLLGPE